MSESVTPPATPGVPEPGPASGTTPAVAEVAAPAAFSPETPVAPAAETTPVVAELAQADAPASETPAADAPVTDAPAETETKPSVLSEAKAEEPEKPAVEEPAKPDAQAEPAKPPTYEPFKLPEGVTLDDDKVGAFTGILAEYEQKISADPAQMHAAAQELGQKLVDLHVAEARVQADRFTRLQAETWQRTREQWVTEFRADPEMGGNRQNTTLARMGAMMDLYGQQVGSDQLQKLRDVFTMTGAGDNPEVLRFVNWAAGRLTETARPVVPVVQRVPVPGASRAARLYRNTNGAA